VRVEVVEEKERWARARLLDVLRPGPDRLQPPCPYFGPGLCGGCHWQHIAYPRQAELKQEIVADQLRRLGHLADPPVADIAVMADPAAPDDTPQLLSYGYRNQTLFAVAPEGRPGYRRAAAPGVIAVDRCLLLCEQLDALHTSLDLEWPAMTGLALRAGVNTGQAMMVLHTAADDEPELELDVPAACALMTPRGLRPLIGDPWIEEAVADRLYRISAGSVFPVSTPGAEVLVEVVLAYAAAGPDDAVLDVCCGVGLLTLALADAAREVVGIDAAPVACEDFAINAGEQANVVLHEGPLEEVLPALSEQGQRFDVAVFTAPRAGAGPEVVRQIAGLGPRRIVYVAADPALLARDGIYLLEAGYRLREVQPIDMEPQTFHVETVALWEKTP
jgi:23S rRNA (uracil1939-C5)-methyltransferase